MRPWMILALAVACGDDAPPDKPKIPVITGQQVDHAQAGADAFSKEAFPCCSSAAATRVVGATVGLAEALAADDAARAQERVTALQGALAAATTDPGTTDATRPHVESMAALADRMAGQDLAGMREELLDLSTPAVAFAAAHRGGELQVAVAFCPMKPGRWLQAAAEIANPYYGSEMLRCGVFEALPEAG